MNNFYKTAYDLGAQQALQDFGITKEAGALQALRAKAVQALGAAKGLPSRASEAYRGLPHLGWGRTALAAGGLAVPVLGASAFWQRYLGDFTAAKAREAREVEDAWKSFGDLKDLEGENRERKLQNVIGDILGSSEGAMPLGDIPEKLRLEAHERMTDAVPGSHLFRSFGGFGREGDRLSAIPGFFSSQPE